MYARLILLSLGAGKRSTGEKIADIIAPLYRAAKGFKSVTFFAADETGECGALSLWESREDAEAAGASFRLKLQELTTGILEGPPTVRGYEVYEPKG